MNPSKSLLVLAALALAPAVHAHPLAPASGVVLVQDFNDIAALPGWVLNNQSTPPGFDWFQGNPGIFAAQAGAPDSYAAANFLSALGGSGAIDNWLITPAINLNGHVDLSFFTRSAGDPGFTDTLELRFSPTGALSPASFSTLLATIGGASSYPATWQQVLSSFDATGVGRFAFRYLGNGDTANYIGIDTLSVSLAVTAVPEPAAWSVALAGLLGLAALRRRKESPAARSLTEV
jgi:MYXO-CTERM domain-containing protein